MSRPAIRTNADANADGAKAGARETDCVACEKCPPCNNALYIRAVCGRESGCGCESADSASVGYGEQRGLSKASIAAVLSVFNVRGGNYTGQRTGSHLLRHTA